MYCSLDFLLILFILLNEADCKEKIKMQSHISSLHQVSHRFFLLRSFQTAQYQKILYNFRDHGPYYIHFFISRTLIRLTGVEQTQIIYNKRYLFSQVIINIFPENILFFLRGWWWAISDLMSAFERFHSTYMDGNNLLLQNSLQNHQRKQ